MPLLVLRCLSPTAAWAYDVHDNTFSHNRDGIWQLQDRTPIEAIAEFKAALALKPPSSIAATLYHNWGIAACAMRDYPAAFEAFQQACRLQPTYIVFRQDLAHAYALSGKLHQAQTTFRDALALNPKDGEVWLLLGFLYQEQEQLEAGKKTVETPKKMPEANKQHGTGKQKASPISNAPSYADLARLCFEQYLKLQPESEMARSVKSILKQIPEEPGRPESAKQPAGSAPLPQEGAPEGAAVQGNPPPAGTTPDGTPATSSPPGENASQSPPATAPSADSTSSPSVTPSESPSTVAPSSSPETPSSSPNASPSGSTPAPAPSDSSETPSSPPNASPSGSTPAPAPSDSSETPSSPSNASPSGSTPAPAPSDSSETPSSPSNVSPSESTASPASSDSSGTTSSPSNAPSSVPSSSSPSLPSGP
jgi:Tetratricopeptide repeat